MQPASIHALQFVARLRTSKRVNYLLTYILEYILYTILIILIKGTLQAANLALLAYTLVTLLLSVGVLL